MLFLTWKHGSVSKCTFGKSSLVFLSVLLPGTCHYLFYCGGNSSFKQQYKSSCLLFGAPAVRCCSRVGRAETSTQSDAHGGICGAGSCTHQPLGSLLRCRDVGVVGQQLPPACLPSGPLPCFSIPSSPRSSLCPGDSSPPQTQQDLFLGASLGRMVHGDPVGSTRLQHIFPPTSRSCPQVPTASPSLTSTMPRGST